MARTRTRILVVEDSPTIRARLIEVLRADPELEVVGEAEDGRRAIELCLELRPDAITLDMMLPVMSGLAATEYIMAHRPTPILIVSSSVNRGELFRTYEALAAGAVDVLEKPNGIEPEGSWEKQLVSSVKLVSRIKVITHPRARLGTISDSPRRIPTAEPGPVPSLVAIGASTGGPGAVLEILTRLPTGFPLPILLVVHIGRAFSPGFADWLAGRSSFPVGYAVDGEPLPQPGQARVVVAPPDRHLVVRQNRLRLTEDPERHHCRPSVDVMFESVARELGSEAVACLLTGMGRDGAAGLVAIRRAGGVTIAQDEATCVIFGMPREAILMGGADQVVALPDIAPTLAGLATRVRRGRMS